jgi:hypothetical protein
MQELVSISEAARRLGRDFRTVKKFADKIEPLVMTRTGGLYDLRELEKLNGPVTRNQASLKMIALAPKPLTAK